MARDIDERRKSVRWLTAQHATASVLAESESLVDAIPRILRAICENLDWDWGELWMPDSSGRVLTCVEWWHKPSTSKSVFEAATQRTTFERGVGLPGTVRATGAPLWIADVTEHDNFVRVQTARRAGLHGAFAFPIRLAEKTLGVMTFFSREIRQPDEQVLQMLDVIGNQIGQFVERQRAKQALRKSADRLAQAQKIANLGSWEFNLETEEVTWSEQMYRIYGVDPETFTPTFASVREWIVESDRPAVESAFERVRSTGEDCSIEHRISRPDGSVRWLVSRAHVVHGENGRPAQLLGTALDITERKQAEERLHRQIALEHLVAEVSTRFINAHSNNIDATIEEALGRIARFVGADRSRIVQFGEDRALFYNTHEWTAEAVLPRHEDLQEIPEEVFGWALGRLREDRPLIVQDVSDLPDEARRMRDLLQKIRIQSCLLVPLWQEGDLQGFTAFCRVRGRHAWSEDTVTLLRMMTDVCVNALQRKRVEEELFRIRQLVESASDAIGLADPNGWAIYHNPAFIELFGYTPKELNDAGGPSALFVDEEKGRTIVKATMEGRTWQGDVEMQSRDGDVVQIALRGGPIRDGCGNVIGLFGIHTDVTERKRVEEALWETEKLAATGRMAAGIAHEINNPLAGIKTAFRLVKQALPTDFKYSSFVNRIEREIDRISGIVRQMYSLYRPNREGASQFSLRELLENAAFVLRATARKQDTSIEINVDAATDRVVLPEGSVSQVLYNLMSNALQASPTGGIVRVDGEIGKERLTLRIADQGPGIPSDIQAQIFEPFFTQRRHMPNEEEGMGLGLSVSKTLTESMGGRLWFESKEGEGTTFVVELPRKQPDVFGRDSSGSRDEWGVEALR